MKELMAQKLAQTFSPTYLKITDNSDKHHGHTGNPDGAGNTHFSIEMTSACFKNISAVAGHKLVYASLGEWMNNPIHALSLKLTS